MAKTPQQIDGTSLAFFQNDADALVDQMNELILRAEKNFSSGASAETFRQSAKTAARLAATASLFTTICLVGEDAARQTAELEDMRRRAKAGQHDPQTSKDAPD